MPSPANARGAPRQPHTMSDRGGATCDLAHESDDIGSGRLERHEASSIAELASWHASEYRRVKGIGRIKGLQLAAIAEIARRMMKTPASPNMPCNRADAIAAMFWPIVTELQVEKFW